MKIQKWAKLNKQKPLSLKQKINRICIIACGILFAGFLLLLLWCCYLYPDARYAKDNYNYLLSRRAEIGLKTAKSHVWEPLAIDLYRLHYYTENWTLAYLQTVSGVEEGSVDLGNLKSNPYDTLSRLVLTGYSDDVQDVYTDIAYCAAACNEDFPINEETLSLWVQERESYRIKAINACSSQAMIFVFLFFATASCFALEMALIRLAKSTSHTKNPG